jgi:phosphoribosylformylglycinamidine (FGAM) synthase-like enzyme
LFTGIKHEDILSEFEKEVNLEDIKSIQMTETSCIATINSEHAKYKILNSEILLKYRSVNLFEIDKHVIKVTIKDAPCEVSDQFIARAVTFYMTTNMLAQDIIFTVLGYVALCIAAKTSLY